jgi:hypothetical protein
MKKLLLIVLIYTLIIIPTLAVTIEDATFVINEVDGKAIWAKGLRDGGYLVIKQTTVGITVKRYDAENSIVFSKEFVGDILVEDGRLFGSISLVEFEDCIFIEGYNRRWESGDVSTGHLIEILKVTANDAYFITLSQRIRDPFEKYSQAEKIYKLDENNLLVLVDITVNTNDSRDVHRRVFVKADKNGIVKGIDTSAETVFGGYFQHDPLPGAWDDTGVYLNSYQNLYPRLTKLSKNSSVIWSIQREQGIELEQGVYSGRYVDIGIDLEYLYALKDGNGPNGINKQIIKINKQTGQDISWFQDSEIYPYRLEILKNGNLLVLGEKEAIKYIAEYSKDFEKLSAISSTETGQNTLDIAALQDGGFLAIGSQSVIRFAPEALKIESITGKIGDNTKARVQLALNERIESFDAIRIYTEAGTFLGTVTPAYSLEFDLAEGMNYFTLELYTDNEKIKGSKLLTVDKKNVLQDTLTILNDKTGSKVIIVNDSNRFYSNNLTNQQIVQNILKTGQGVYFIGDMLKETENLLRPLLGGIQ